MIKVPSGPTPAHGDLPCKSGWFKFLLDEDIAYCAISKTKELSRQACLPKFGLKGKATKDVLLKKVSQETK